MTRLRSVTHEFVEFIPGELQDGRVYVSITYATAVHKCACGCGGKVVTPLSPVDWQLTFDGIAVSLFPSIGNWSFPCRSHYWIRGNRIEWARSWSQQAVDASRARDEARRRSALERPPAAEASPATTGEADTARRPRSRRRR